MRLVITLPQFIKGLVQRVGVVVRIFWREREWVVCALYQCALPAWFHEKR